MRRCSVSAPSGQAWRTMGVVDVVDYPDSKKIAIAAGVKNADFKAATYVGNLFDIFGPALIASLSSAVCYLVARRDFPPRDAVLVVICLCIPDRTRNGSWSFACGRDGAHLR